MPVIPEVDNRSVGVSVKGGPVAFEKLDVLRAAVYLAHGREGDDGLPWASPAIYALRSYIHQLSLVVSRLKEKEREMDEPWWILTEDEWLGCQTPDPLLWHIEDKSSTRKQRLFACGCCRLIWHLLKDERARRVVEAAEAFAEGVSNESQLETAYELGSLLCQEAEVSPLPYYQKWALEGGAQAVSFAAGLPALYTQDIEGAAGWAVHAVVGNQSLDDPVQEAERLASYPVEQGKQVALARDLFGNPFRPLPTRQFPPHVVALATDCYACFPQVTDQFLILADALEELGAGEPAAHCRAPLHAKGCHVLDWILGKE
jgi:hypothetical protein